MNEKLLRAALDAGAWAVTRDYARGFVYVARFPTEAAATARAAALQAGIEDGSVASVRSPDGTVKAVNGQEDGGENQRQDC